MSGWFRSGVAGLALMLAWLSPGCAQAREIVALLDTHVAAYAEALAGFRQQSSIPVRVVGCRENGSVRDERALIPRIRAEHSVQVLAIGDEPLRALAGRLTELPVIFCMVANPASIMGGARNITGVSTDTPPGRLMALAGRFAVHMHRIGVVYNPDESGYMVAAARKVLARHHQVLVARPAHSSRQALEALRKLMPHVDAYWVVRDRLFRASEVIRYVFAMADRYDTPLIGYSDRLVRAGSLFAYSSDHTLMGRQAANLSSQVLAGKRAGALPVEMPRVQMLSVNRKSFRHHRIRLSKRLMRRAWRVY